MAAFGLPIVLLTALRAQKPTQFMLGTIGVAVLSASLFLTRSRAGWLALGAVLLVVFGALLLAPALRRDRRTWGRLTTSLVFSGAAVAGALLLPNSLRWRSDNPYLESITGVANFQEGSGAGRLVQYRQSMRMLAAHPVLGVGPGNWPVAYAKYAARRDPSLDRREPGTTANPWPSSDWVAFASERGGPALIVLLLALGGIAVTTLRQLFRARDADEALGAAALLAMLFAASVAGCFDAVMLLALPTLLVWASIGALWGPPATQAKYVAPGKHGVAVIAVAVLAGLGAARSTAQLIGIGIYSTQSSTAWLRNAARIDPGNYRVQLRLARGGSGLNRAQRCKHARAAHDLLPNAVAARDLSQGCGTRR
jgi:O-antigen ligase